MSRRALVMFGCAFVTAWSSLSPGAKAGSEAVLYSFQGMPDGASPNGTPLIDASGAIYGTTQYGGIQCTGLRGTTSAGCGTVFKLVKGGDGVWRETILFSFNSSLTGMKPSGPLLMDSNGALYGYASGGRAVGSAYYKYYGTVYKLMPPAGGVGAWTETVIRKFLGQPAGDGALPSALIADGAGGFYGATVLGGTFGYGTVFRLTPPKKPTGLWTETIIHSFQKTDGANPSGPLALDSKGNLFGATQYGVNDTTSLGGAVFELSPNGSGGWTYRIIHAFGSSGDGVAPVTGVLLDATTGALFGNTESVVGNPQPDRGLVYKLTRRLNGTWVESKLFVPSRLKGVTIPTSARALTFSGGNLFLPYGGGGSAGFGVVQELKPPLSGTPWTSSIIYNFAGTPDGGIPRSGLAVDTAGALYGVTELGGANNQGAVYSVTP